MERAAAVYIFGRSKLLEEFLMKDIYSQYRVKDPRQEINDRYPALLDDDEVFNQVICIANSAYYYKLLRTLSKGYGSVPEMADEIIQNASLRVYQLREKRFHDAQIHIDFYAYLIRIYENVTNEMKRSAFRTLKHEVSYDKGTGTEEEGEDMQIQISDNNQGNPLTGMEAGFDAKEKKQMGSLLMEALANTKTVPHMVIAYCYSVLLPIMLKAYVSGKVNMSGQIRRILAEMETEEFTFPALLMTEKAPKLPYAERFKEKMGDVLESMKELPIPLEKFCLSLFIAPEISVLLESAERGKKKFYKRILEELSISDPDATRIDRNSEILTECAKILMDRDTVRKMSWNFEEVYNDYGYFSRRFQWGEEYLRQLDSEYADARHGFYVPNDGDVIFTEVFSKPLDTKSGTEVNKNNDRLGKNIRNFSTRMRERLLKDTLALAAEREEALSSEGSMKRIQNAYARYKVVNGNVRKGKRGEER